MKLRYNHFTLPLIGEENICNRRRSKRIIHGVEDVPVLLEILRMNYDRLMAGCRAKSSEESEETSANTALKSTSTEEQQHELSHKN